MAQPHHRPQPNTEGQTSLKKSSASPVEENSIDTPAEIDAFLKSPEGKALIGHIQAEQNTEQFMAEEALALALERNQALREMIRHFLKHPKSDATEFHEAFLAQLKALEEEDKHQAKKEKSFTPELVEQLDKSVEKLQREIDADEKEVKALDEEIDFAKTLENDVLAFLGELAGLPTAELEQEVDPALNANNTAGDLRPQTPSQAPTPKPNRDLDPATQKQTETYRHFLQQHAAQQERMLNHMPAQTSNLQAQPRTTSPGSAAQQTQTRQAPTQTATRPDVQTLRNQVKTLFEQQRTQRQALSDQKDAVSRTITQKHAEMIKMRYETSRLQEQRKAQMEETQKQHQQPSTTPRPR